MNKYEKEIIRLEEELVRKENTIKELMTVNQKLQDELHLRNYNQYKKQIIIDDNKFNDALALLFTLIHYQFKKKGH